MAENFRYRAFISYSHADESWARWLHRRLERYRVPSRLAGNQGLHGTVPRHIGRCFRDQADLSAASHLGETLRQALRDSQVLIVVCSPRAAGSRWVNEEIKYFRSIGRGDHVYALIVDGEPNAAEPRQECFPPALLRDGNDQLQEPLAADAREGRDGRADGFLKLAAGVLGVDFDQLRQRDARRRTQLMLVAVAASIAIAAITSILAITAYQARNEAQARRQQADDLINFLLGDLKDRLVPVGRLDVLDAAADQVMKYLSDDDVARMDDRALVQRVKALVLLTDVRDARSQIPAASETAAQAVQAARELVRRKPENPDAAYLLASALQSSVNMLFETGEMDSARAPIDEGLHWIAKVLAGRPNDADAIHVDALYRGFSAFLYSSKGDYVLAYQEFKICADEVRPLVQQPEVKPEFWRLYFQCKGAAVNKLSAIGAIDKVVPAYQELLAEERAALQRNPEDMNLLAELMGELGLAAESFIDAGRIDLATEAAREAVELGRRLVAHDRSNGVWTSYLANALRGQGQLMIALEDWAALEQSADEEIAIIEEHLKAKPKDSAKRPRLSDAHGHRALGRARQGKVADAQADWEAQIALAADDDSPGLQLGALSAHLRIWELLADRDPARAQSARAASQALIERFGANETSLASRWQTALKERLMRYAYLSGHPADGDQYYAELRDADSDLAAGATQSRRQLCARLVERGGVGCAAVKEWAPPTTP